MALYQDHNEWRSERTGVPDLEDWQEIYGEDIAGLAVFNNRSAAVPDSSYTGQFTIYRAGNYEIRVMINGVDVKASPVANFFKVRPAELHPPACIIEPFEPLVPLASEAGRG